MRSVLRLAVLVGMLSAFVVAPAQAQQTLDQEQATTSGTAFSVTQTSRVAQTFIAGLTGTLTQVDLFLNKQEVTSLQPLTVEIRNTVAGVPGNTVLATATVPAAAVTPAGSFVSVTFAPGAPVVAGTQYAIFLQSPTSSPPNAYGWVSAPGNPYPRGAPFFSTGNPPGVFTPGGDFDFAFRTYLTIAAYRASFSVERLTVTGRTLSFRMIGPAKVRFTLDRRIAPKRYRRVGSFVRKARKGRNRVRIPSRLNGKPVRKGVYRLSARTVGGGMPSGPLERRIARLR